METIVFGVVGFTILIVALVLVLLGAKSKLVPSGEVSIGINGDPSNTLKAKSGNTLLNTLSENKIFIPSACGGKGAAAFAKSLSKKVAGRCCRPKRVTSAVARPAKA